MTLPLDPDSTSKIVIWTYKPNKPFPVQVAFSQSFTTTEKKQRSCIFAIRAISIGRIAQLLNAPLLCLNFYFFPKFKVLDDPFQTLGSLIITFSFHITLSSRIFLQTMQVRYLHGLTRFLHVCGVHYLEIILGIFAVVRCAMD